METIKNTLLTNWNFMRWLRFALALIIAYQAFEIQSGLMALISALILFQALSNTGCGASGCYVKPFKTTSDKIVHIEFEEVKTEKRL